MRNTPTTQVMSGDPPELPFGRPGHPWQDPLPVTREMTSLVCTYFMGKGFAYYQTLRNLMREVEG